MKCERALGGWKQIKIRGKIPLMLHVARMAHLRMPFVVSHEIPVINTEIDLCLRFGCCF